MRRRLFLGLSLVVALSLLLAGCPAPKPTPTPAPTATPSPTPTPTPIPTATYRNAVYQYALSYPAGWQVTEESPEQVEIKPAAGVPIVRIIATDLGIELAAETLVEFLKLGLPLEEESRRKLREDTYEVVASGIPPELGYKIKSKLRVQTQSSRGYLVMASVPEALYEALLPVLDSLLGSFVLTAPAPAPVPLAWDTYESRAWGYALSYPRGWSFQSTVGDREIQFSLEPPLALIGVRVDDLPAPLSLEELVPSFLQSFLQEVPSFRETSRRTTAVGGLPALELKGTFLPADAPSGISLEMTMLLVLRGQRLYAPWGILWPSLGEKLGPVVRQALDSFRLIEVTLPSPTPTPTARAAPSSQPAGSYQSPTYGWAVAYPAELTLEEIDRERDVRILVPPGFVQVRLQEMPVEVSLDLILPALLPQIQSSLPGYQEVSRTRTTRTREKVPTLELVATMAEGTSKVKMKLIIMMRSKVVYVLTAGAPDADYERIAPQLDRILSSFDFYFR